MTNTDANQPRTASDAAPGPADATGAHRTVRGIIARSKGAPVEMVDVVIPAPGPNDVIVHGIPSADVVLQEGDLLSVDCGATFEGWVGDSAWTFGIGEVDEDVEKLNQATEWVLHEGLKAMIPGNRLTDVSHALEKATRAAEEKFGVQLGIVDGYGGHGIGRTMHEDPFLANEGRPGRGPRIQAGSVLAIEPMLTLGTTDSAVLEDDWTVVTLDGSFSSHWEHTVAATDTGPRILTPRL